jgi:hypothetical protein
MRSFYECTSYAKGRACSANERVKRRELEAKIVAPVHERLLAPARVRQMACELETEYSQGLVAAQARGAAVPQELAELNARIDRLRARLAAGDPDMAPDEIEVAIDRALAKRDALTAPQARRLPACWRCCPRPPRNTRSRSAWG